MTKTFLLFIDSFPYECLPEMDFLSRFQRWQVACGVGYSVNVKAELFGGYRPDDIGYFNQWQYNPESSFRPYHLVLKLLTPFSANYYLDRVLHKALGQFLFNHSLLNIPFQYLGFFDSQGVSAYEDAFSMPTVFSECRGMLKLRYSDLPSGLERDDNLFDLVLDRIQRADYEAIFVASADLDHLTHKYGLRSPQHLAKLRSLDRLVAGSFQAFITRYPDGQLIMISDHSMANVTQTVDLDLATRFGPASEQTYLYFVDANMLRVWTFHPDIQQMIGEHLLNWDVGRLLAREERTKYGVTRAEFGKFIFILNEGLVFQKTFWGQTSLKAMHGYHPDTFSQKGFVVSNHSLFSTDQAVTSLQVFDTLGKLIQ